MAAPFFYVDSLPASTHSLTLNEDTSKHIISVLRMQNGEAILLTDGRGSKANASIVDDNRKRCSVQINTIDKEEPVRPHITIAISIVKNFSRFEWFLEKATEIGVNEIIPLICERTEKEKFRFERMQGILISAMLQSQQSWLPHLHHPTSFKEVVQKATVEKKYIAHCLPEKKQHLSSVIRHQSSIILIGPEGDFTSNEIDLALQNNFTPVALGNTRLRTETAGMVAATLLRIGNAS